ncbi:hypothetical protein P170DRAFT_471265 [Aspergillus steynii IBT 23096]|uniref:RING-type domain-containing protein n=1 Tax=Aspergillus steynii IBT 23096 TaxID=1392250 RepID=A0A2I2GSL2_9EURO|nr:uncharacterized protein P170DRAFT_471265 [Aspergillus steynii IBT 23096]PLB55867.1 hypothetical protein P170DRAFT_471265 [Aspergillus steynii IBT 23096]
MEPEPRSGPGLGDLEKELTCSICTDLLYQPLTLLDCLHTFCGSCLKEWFAVQGGARRRSSSSSPRFTCPSCRAVVRETRPNATVTTLLDMVLANNPERAKPEPEREEIAKKYKHGESVFPALVAEASAGAEGEEDRRLLEEVRELSLRDARRSARESRSRAGRAESVDADARSRRRREEDRAARRHQQQQQHRALRSEDASRRTRQIEHQSSLRSLLSLSDTETMEEEILRQILEEGLLEDIDLDNLGPRQEEELSERIADAYRRRHRLRSRSQQRQEGGETPSQPSSRPRARSQSVQRPPPSAPTTPTTTTSPRESSRNPPVSRPYLLDPLVSRSGQPGHHRRLSDQGSSRRRTSPVPVNPASSSEVSLRPATRSSSDMVAERPRNSYSERARASDSTAPRSRRATASEQSVPNIWVNGANDRELRRQRPGRQSIDIPTSAPSPLQNVQNNSSARRPEPIITNPATTSSLTAEISSPVRQDARSRSSSSRSTASQMTASYVEPSISCDRCGKANIQYSLHKKCTECKEGGYHLCLRCYRQGRGCLNWAGFGPSAKTNYEQICAASNDQPAPSNESQHILMSSKYKRPVDGVRRSRDGREVTSDDPARRLQTGLFCEICHSPANNCFWKCNDCNEGDWGFCNRCVNQGKCCTHALLPICRVAADTRSDLPTPSSARSEAFKILAFSTNCDICAHPIPPSVLRFHCLECNNGDYDICANCYLKLVATGKIRKENGHNGWRRCLKGHRMVVIGFEDHEAGQQRVIVCDLVGGRALKDEHVQHSSSASASPVVAGTPSSETPSGDWSWKEGAERRKKASRVRTPWMVERDRNGSHHSTSEPSTPITASSNPSTRRFPPNGGVGVVLHALWSWYPEDGMQDELMFPRGAEITEAENINDDWYWGCYAGSTGLFPGAHVFVVGEIA